MKSLLHIYKSHIYGIIGTLAFHALLVSFLLLSGLDLRNKFQEKTVIIELPVEFETLMEKMADHTEGPEVQSTLVPSSDINQPSRMNGQTSAPAVHDRYFDDKYRQEMEEARQLVTDVNIQLAKEPMDMKDIQMPEDVTDGRSKDEISPVVYAGESNVEYRLENRYHLRMPVPVYLARGGGTVIVDISVNREGKVMTARLRKNNSVIDELVYQYAQVAAQRTIFNADPAAPAIQNGTIRYTFISQ